MCLALVKTKNVTIETEILRSGFDNNPDGAGFAYAKDEELVIEKGFFTFESFLEAYNKIPEDVCALIHFRLASHGAVNEYNCHPWKINEDFCFIHNGMLQGFGDWNSSDTEEFGQKVLTPLFNGFKNPREDFQAPHIEFLVGSTIGRYNKICVLSKWGEITIYNAEQGFWSDGVWHSNGGGFYSYGGRACSGFTTNNQTQSSKVEVIEPTDEEVAALFGFGGGDELVPVEVKVNAEDFIIDSDTTVESVEVGGGEKNEDYAG